MSRPRLRGALADPRFRLLIGGQFVNELGSSMFPVALVSLVLTDRGPAMLGLLLAVRGIATSAVGVFAGVVVGKVRKTRALIVNDLAQLVIVLAFATQPDQVGVLIALAALSGIFGSVVEPAAGSLLPAILPAEQLQQGNAIKSIANRTAAIAGPAVAGLLVTASHPVTVFLVNGVTFLLSALALAAVREPRTAAEPVPVRFLHDLRLGLAEVARRPWVVAIIAIATVQAPLTIAPGFTVLPVVAAADYTSALYGIALSCMSAGEVLGGLLAARWVPRRPGLVSLVGVLPYPLVLLALAATLPAAVILVGYALVGVGFMLFGVYWYTALQREIPQEKLGLVLSLDQVGSFGLQPLGYAAAGALAAAVGPKPVLLGAGLFGLVTTLVPLAVPGVPRLAGAREAEPRERTPATVP